VTFGLFKLTISIKWHIHVCLNTQGVCCINARLGNFDVVSEHINNCPQSCDFKGSNRNCRILSSVISNIMWKVSWTIIVHVYNYVMLLWSYWQIEVLSLICFTRKITSQLDLYPKHRLRYDIALTNSFLQSKSSTMVYIYPSQLIELRYDHIILQNYTKNGILLHCKVVLSNWQKQDQVN